MEISVLGGLLAWSVVHREQSWGQRVVALWLFALHLTETHNEEHCAIEVGVRIVIFEFSFTIGFWPNLP